MIVTSGQVGVEVIRELCQTVLDGKGIPYDSKTSIVVQIYEGKKNLELQSYRGVKLLKHNMKIIERVLE